MRRAVSQQKLHSICSWLFRRDRASRRPAAFEVEPHQHHPLFFSGGRREGPLPGGLDGDPLEIAAWTRLICRGGENVAVLVDNHANGDPDCAANRVPSALRNIRNHFADRRRRRSWRWRHCRLYFRSRRREGFFRRHRCRCTRRWRRRWRGWLLPEHGDREPAQHYYYCERCQTQQERKFVHGLPGRRRWLFHRDFYADHQPARGRRVGLRLRCFHHETFIVDLIRERNRAVTDRPSMPPYAQHE